MLDLGACDVPTSVVWGRWHRAAPRTRSAPPGDIPEHRVRDRAPTGSEIGGAPIAPHGRMRTVSRTGIITIAIIAGLFLLGGSCVAGYNRLVRLDQAAQAQWGQVENTYQRRADLIPNLVETVKGAADFERGTITAVTEARSRV